MKSGILVVKLQQLALEGRQLEEVILFADRLGDAAAVGAGRSRRPIDIQLVGDAVLAGVGALVDEAAIAQRGEQLLHAALVPRLGGADEVVVGQAQPVPQRAKLGRDRRSANSCGVRPASLAERSIFCPCSSVPVRNQVSMPMRPLAPRDGVAHDGRVGVAQVRPRIHVVDRRGQVEAVGDSGISRLGFPAIARCGRTSETTLSS